MSKQHAISIEVLREIVHELKTPLAAIKSFVDLAQNAGDLNESQARFLARAMAGVGKMEEMIREVMDFAHLESNQALNIQPLNLSALLEDILSHYEGPITLRRLKVNRHVEGDLEPLYSDSRLLRFILSNLISNAVKYNRDGGSLTVVAEREGGVLALSVRDTGIGIAPDELSQVFERFFRSRNQNIRRIEGTGLGLDIALTAAHRLGGQIDVDSNLGEGTVFILRLPLQVMPRPDASDATPSELPDAIDDNLQEASEPIENDSATDTR